jgi:hypothetical protein
MEGCEVQRFIPSPYEGYRYDVDTLACQCLGCGPTASLDYPHQCEDPATAEDMLCDGCREQCARAGKVTRSVGGD